MKSKITFAGILIFVVIFLCCCTGEQLFTVVFDSSGGSAVAEITGIENGASIDKPEDPAKPGYAFDGWFSAEDKEWDFEKDSVTDDITLYAKWSELYTVLFDADGGTETAGETGMKSGTKIARPDDPIKPGCDFIEWQAESGIAWDFENDIITENITLYAVWEEHERTEGLSYTLNSDGETYSVSIGTATNEEEIIIPSGHNGKWVTIVRGFSNSKNLKSVKMPDSIIEIYSGAFRDNINLTTVEIGAKTEFIRGFSFMGCTSLTDIVIPGSVLLLSSYAFAGCTALSNVTLNEGLQAIGSFVFAGGEDLKSIEIPSTVVAIASAAFAETGLIPEDRDTVSLVYVGNWLVGGSGWLTGNIRVREGTVGVADGSGRPGITGIVLPEGLKYIGYMAFYSCAQLKEVVIPSSVEVIGLWAFAQCNAIEKVFYGGTAAGWAQITNHDTLLITKPIYYYSASQPTEAGSYWHYAGDGITPVIWQ